MTIRALSLLLLFVTAFVFSSTLSAVGVSAASFFGWSTRVWVVPLLLFVCNLTLFFLGRRFILPDHLVSPSGRALLLLAAWIGLTMLITGGVVWAIRDTPLGAFLSGGRIMLAWFLLLLGSGTLLAHRGRRSCSR